LWEKVGAAPDATDSFALGPAGTRRVCATPLRDIDDWLERFRGFWTHKLASLATEIARGKKQRHDP
jgi:hypothetical protein